MASRCEGRLRFRAVAHLDGEAIVVRGLRPDRGGPARLGDIDRRREVLVVDRHQLGGIQRPVAGLGDDEGDRGADMPRGIQRDGWGRRQPCRSGHDRVVDREARDRAEPVGAVILARQHGEHARRRARGRGASIDAIRAWACGDRATAPCAMRGSTRSST